MFLLNLGYQWRFTEEVEGAVFLPTGNTCPRLLRSPLPEFKRVLLDPQLYLAGLNAADCRLVCARLASYPWFGVSNLPEFDSSSRKQREWEKEMQDLVAPQWPGSPPADMELACFRAIEIQLQISCTQIILPSPLIREREDEAQTQVMWLDAGIAVAQELQVGQPLLATVAVHEATLNEAAFSSGGFLDTVVDQVTAREGLEGVYIVIIQDEAGHPFESSGQVQSAYYYLSSAFSGRGYGTVLTNFADVFGLVCLGSGATGVASGSSQSLRRMALAGFREEGGGIALPRLYSHKLTAELATEADLDRIVQAKLLRRVSDLSPHSDTLMQTLASGGSASQLQPWAESRSNVSTAHRHFIYRMATEEKSLMRLGMADRKERIET